MLNKQPGSRDLPSKIEKSNSVLIETASTFESNDQDTGLDGDDRLLHGELSNNINRIQSIQAVGELLAAAALPADGDKAGLQQLLNHVSWDGFIQHGNDKDIAFALELLSSKVLKATVVQQQIYYINEPPWP